MAYTGTSIKDLDASAPAANCVPSEVDDAIREVKTVYTNQHVITSTGSSITLTATHAVVVVTATATITLPTASGVGSSTKEKEYVIVNDSTYTVTVAGIVNGVTNPTLTGQYDVMTVFTDGTSWYEKRVKNAKVAGTATSATSATGADKVKVGQYDTTYGYLSSKVVAGNQMVLTDSGTGTSTLTVAVKNNFAATVVTSATGTAAVDIDATAGNQVNIIMTANRTVNIPTGGVAGQKLVIAAYASGTACTLTLTSTGTNCFRYGTDVTTLTATTANKTDYIGCIYNATDSRWDVVCAVKAY